MVLGVTRCSSRAPATVNALKVEPGSYVKPVAMFCRSCGSAPPRSLGSTVRPVGHRQDLRVARVHDDRRRALGLVGLADVREHLLGPRLDLGVDRQLQVLAVARAA